MNFNMDEQAWGAFEDNLKTLLQFTKHISTQEENLTQDEEEFFSGIAGRVQGFMTRSTEIHIKYVGLREPGWMASYWSLIYQFFSSWMAPIPLFFFDRVHQAHQKSRIRADSRDGIEYVAFDYSTPFDFTRM
jgi:hypothetical protein